MATATKSFVCYGCQRWVAEVKPVWSEGYKFLCRPCEADMAELAAHDTFGTCPDCGYATVRCDCD